MRKKPHDPDIGGATGIETPIERFLYRFKLRFGVFPRSGSFSDFHLTTLDPDELQTTIRAFWQAFYNARRRNYYFYPLQELDAIILRIVRHKRRYKPHVPPPYPYNI